MSYWLFVVAAAVVAYALLARRLGTTVVTGPMVFVTFGLVIGSEGLGIIDADVDAELVSVLLELTLAVVLFSDATTINSSRWRQEAFIPGRLLLVGLPLTIVIGTGLAVLLFAELGGWEAALVAAILAPTDASLGQAVVANQRVPRRIRQGLNVESGLNDGIALPLVIIFLAAAEESATGGSVGEALSFIGQEVVVAAAIGVGVGWLGAHLLVASHRRGWTSTMWVQVGALALAATAYGLAVPLHGSGFIAAWVTGLTVGRVTLGRLDDVDVFAETLGTVLTMTSFLVFGALLLGPAIDDLSVSIAVFAVLALTLTRMLPVALAMIGSKLGAPSVVFLGWFGPRGLASIIFAGIVIEDAALPELSTIITIVMITVGLSVYAHGATSWLGSERYADWYQGEQDSDPEIAEAGGGFDPQPRRHHGAPPD